MNKIKVEKVTKSQQPDKVVKVVHIITKMELGGAQQNTLFTVRNLNRKKFKTFLVTGCGGGLYDEAKEFNNTFIVKDLKREISPITDLKAIFQIINILGRIKKISPQKTPVIVHTHSSKAGILGRWAAKFSGISIIIHSIHGFGFNDFQPCLLRKLLILSEKVTSLITKKYIAVSRANINKGVELNIFSRSRAKLIRSGIDIVMFKTPSHTRQEVRQRLDIPSNAPVVATITCLKPQKAPCDYVRVCTLVRKEIPNAHFLLAGDGQLRPQVEKEIQAMGLEKSFHLPGWQKDIPGILHAIDVFALTSLWEGLPRVLPQAMTAGSPIVATRVDGSPEAVKDGFNGFLADPGDVSKIAEKIVFFLRNPAIAREMGQNSLTLIREFDIHKMIADQEELYEELI